MSPVCCTAFKASSKKLNYKRTKKSSFSVTALQVLNKSLGCKITPFYPKGEKTLD